MRNEHNVVITSAAVANPVLAPVAVSMMMTAVRHSAWEQSQAVAANNEINSLRNRIIQEIVANGSKRYVPDGVMLVCSTGMNPAKLKVVSQQTVKIASGKSMATLPDRMDCNFNCIKMVLAGALIGAIAAAVVVAAVILSGGTLGVVAAAAIGAGGAAAGAGMGGLAGLIPCVCGMLTSVPWLPVHPTTKVGGNMALVETSQLVCFLGGTVSIFYSPEAAQMVADKNSKTMWFDLGLTVLGGALLGGTAAGVGALIYGGSVAYTTGGLKAVGAYSAGVGAQLGIGSLVGKGISIVTDLGYSQISISTSEGDTNFLALKNAEPEDSGLAPFSQDETYGLTFKESQETLTDVASYDAGEAGGVYPRNVSDPDASFGAWDSNYFVEAATRPSKSAYWSLIKEQGGIGIKANANPFSKVNKRFTFLGYGTDVIKAFRNWMIIEDRYKIKTEGQALEEEAKKGIKVTEQSV